MDTYEILGQISHNDQTASIKLPEKKRESPADVIRANVELFMEQGKKYTEGESVGGNAGHRVIFGVKLSCLGCNFYTDKDGRILKFGNYQDIPKNIRENGVESTWRLGFEFVPGGRVGSDFIIEQYKSKQLSDTGTHILDETVKTINIRQAGNWEELIFAVNIIGDITSTNKNVYSPEVLAEIITRVKNGKIDELETIPRAYGLRKRVIELLKIDDTVQNIPVPLVIKKN